MTFKPGDWVKDAVSGALYMLHNRSGAKLWNCVVVWDEVVTDRFGVPILGNARITTPMPGEIRAAKRRMEG